jgi:hypothetical protein
MATTPSQAQAVVGTLAANVDWSQVDFDALGLQDAIVRNPIESGKNFTAFLGNGGRVIVGDPKVILINRSTPFNPTKFIGTGWTIEEQDERSIALTEVDLTAIRFESMLKEGETLVNGEDKLTRLKDAGHIRLDAKILETLWDNQHLIPAKWKEQTNGNTTFIFFDGTVFRSPRGRRYVLCLYWFGGQWGWDYDRLGLGWLVVSPSAVLAS